MGNETSANELKAREMLSHAAQLNVTPEHYLKLAFNPLISIPQLTDSECKKIAHNFPLTFERIREVFQNESVEPSPSVKKAWDKFQGLLNDDDPAKVKNT